MHSLFCYLLLSSLAISDTKTIPISLTLCRSPTMVISLDRSGEGGGGISSREEFDREGNIIVKNISSDVGGGEKLPDGVIYRDKDSTNLRRASSENVIISGSGNSGQGAHRYNLQSHSNGREEEKQGSFRNTTSGETTTTSDSRSSTTCKIKEMEDQLIIVKTYLHFSSNSNFHLVRELKLRIKEIERVLGRANRDSDVSRRTLPKCLHCLSMRLTTDFFVLKPDEKGLPTTQNVHKSDFYHYVIFSDNVLACAVAVNSTVTTSMEPEKIVFHVITDTFNYPAIVMWFLLNTPGEASIQIQRMDDFGFLPAGFSSMFIQSSNADPISTSPLNHLRFYLPELFPSLNKILLLDHDVLVQRNLRLLWSVDMRGKQMFLMLTAKACLYAFGMNIFDLLEWRRQGLTEIYRKWVKLGNNRKLWKAGTNFLGQLLFYNHTVTLEQQWHVTGLGHDSNLDKIEIETAAVVHYDGNMKPWLDIAIPRYRRYWTKFLDYTNDYLQKCNIHE
ncbi:hypothetical protein Cni_G06712 [Canna indica]|uniref:Hexosyltransferase n=1 Tax=Canna indica TaxID=4628 RepID=A0AAQ3Q6T4_9LILI|nr:hypothetical protein Cni_G06712 [Canna indica]